MERLNVHVLTVTYDSGNPVPPFVALGMSKEELDDTLEALAREEVDNRYFEEEDLLDDLAKFLTAERVAELEPLGLDAIGLLTPVEIVDMAKRFASITPSFDVLPLYRDPPPVRAFDLDDREAAAVLTGLRMIQAQGVPDDLDDLATNGGAFEPLDGDAIDGLCVRINFDVTGEAPAS
ncbi:hypothetical protein HOU03_gp149 [Caulobacter phage CcrSC]|uniref:Uncharacterized protein n=1 Tax=Caulobacter phage CcrSC TaxID=2283272 RepID=A0A385EH09_9CAUD|nr:hypothetical protein HOU03_gp037 [Caulobacter phage CcrSC]YP_009810749.1 hypothetical protein HOU03_gp149 [Caulobacter phage CcrSC]AXQ69619.1 hypothetical protein CcrSC_gp037 [Caulobacter phage CcrSC]AXQ70119.1 hypothetical protein CcrSC_gp537 [Caulobacter phage CcrSC]